MQRNRQLVVAIICAHPLLGEGIARLLAAEPGMEVLAAPPRDTDTALGVLAAGPDVVIFEPGGLLHELDLPVKAPHALLIDVSMGSGPCPTGDARRSGPEEIIRVLRRLRTTAARTAEHVVGSALSG
jgi:DNA-binding NarL/FixJ family response regulator